MKILLILAGIMLPVISQAMMAPTLDKDVRQHYGDLQIKKVLYIGCLICQKLPEGEIIGDEAQYARVDKTKVKLDIYKDGLKLDEFQLQQVSINVYEQKLEHGESIQLRLGQNPQININILQSHGSLQSYKFTLQ